MKRKKGTGYLYQPKQRDGSSSRVFMCQYYDADGHRVRESTRTDDAEAARRFLNTRLGQIAQGQPVMPKADQVRYEEAVQDLRQHYQTTGSRNMVEVEKRLKHLAVFAGRRIANLGPADATAYVARRQSQGAANGTINREVSVLGRMLRLAYENGKLLRLPVIRKLKEAAPRSGFFEEAQFKAVRNRLRPDLQTAVTIAYTYGWRMQSEVLTLERRHLDLEKGTLRLDPGMTKNDDGRVVYLTPEVKSLLSAQVDRVKALERRLKRVVPYLFPHLGTKGDHTSRRLAGTRIKDFKKQWATACKLAGVPGAIRHDFRRTAVRTLERQGVSRSVATKITGHRTESVYRRYAIVSDADLREATRKLGKGPSATETATASGEAE